MKLRTVDRTTEIEQRLKAIFVSSEDVCCFWEKRKNSQVMLKRCFYCTYYHPLENDEFNGLCKFKVQR